MDNDFLSVDGLPEDFTLDQALRPKRFEGFIGQERIKENLHIYIQAARQRNEPLDHILFSGPPGLGKTTLAGIIAREIGANLKSTSGPVIEKAGDLAGMLTKLQEGEVFFIDEIHRISSAVEEYLYSAMEDFVIDIVLDQGPATRSVRIPLQRFTLIGSTTREGLLTSPFRSRFGVVERLDYYPWEDLFQIIRNSAAALNIEIEDKAAEIVSRRARGTPRLVNRYLRRLRDVAQVLGDGVITKTVADDGLGRLGVDQRGLGEMDRRILGAILRAGGAAVGLKTIAVTVGEDENTIEEVYEPYLIQMGYVAKTPRGRVATEAAVRDYGTEISSSEQNRLFS
jgi:Holliday junction DNA helicase RuvB